MKTVLLTGFEPFGGGALNPSEIIAQRLDGAVMARHNVVGKTLSCEFGKALRELKALLKKHRPTIVICLGLANGRPEITPERVAINVDDAPIPDNAGRQPANRPVVRGGPVAYWSTLPVKTIVAALLKRGIPASVSQTAGTFVCNHVFYGLMHELSRGSGGIRGGFIHVPLLPEQAGSQPSLPLERMIEGITIAIETSLHTRRGIRPARRARVPGD